VDFGVGNIRPSHNNGSFNSVFLALPGGTMEAAMVLLTNPVNGHIYVDSGNGITTLTGDKERSGT